MYQALYRKWRPRTFSEVVGQEHITSTLQKQVAEGRIGHAYLFTGTRGTGKTTCARILAKAINCENPIDGAPCCQCEACRAIEEGTTLDITELDAASNNGVDHVRALREEAIYTPTTLKKRVYIIDEVHMLSTAAFNALLKILEEPPEHLVFILATTELHKVLPTILSRCQRFTFKRILPRDIAGQLQKIAQAENIELLPEGADILSRMANGALRDALSLLDQCRVVNGTLDAKAVLDVLGLTGSLQTMQMMRCLVARQSADVLALFDQLYRGGKDIAAMLGELSDLCRDITIVKAAPESGSALLTGLYEQSQLQEMAERDSLARFVSMASTLQNCCSTLQDSTRPRTDAELCLLKLCDESLCGDITGLVCRIERLEKAAESGTLATAKVETSSPAGRIREEKLSPHADMPSFAEEPPLPEEPPFPEEVPSPREMIKQAPESSAVSGDSAIWSQLLEHYKGRLSVNLRVFLSMVTGLLDGDVLTVQCPNDFVRDSLNNDTVITVLQSETAAAVGHDIHVEFMVGKISSAKTDPTPSKALSEKADPLDSLMNKGKGLAHFKIED